MRSQTHQASSSGQQGQGRRLIAALLGCSRPHAPTSGDGVTRSRHGARQPDRLPAPRWRTDNGDLTAPRSLALCALRCTLTRAAPSAPEHSSVWMPDLDVADDSGRCGSAQVAKSHAATPALGQFVQPRCQVLLGSLAGRGNHVTLLVRNRHRPPAQLSHCRRFSSDAPFDSCPTNCDGPSTSTPIYSPRNSTTKSRL